MASTLLSLVPIWRQWASAKLAAARPWLKTSAVISAEMWIGDACCQQIENGGALNVQRSNTMAITGLTTTGPLVHWLVHALERIAPGAHPSAVLTKVLLNCGFMPVMFGAALASTSLLQGHGLSGASRKVGIAPRRRTIDLQQRWPPRAAPRPFIFEYKARSCLFFEYNMRTDRPAAALTAQHEDPHRREGSRGRLARAGAGGAAADVGGGPRLLARRQPAPLPVRARRAQDVCACARRVCVRAPRQPALAPVAKNMRTMRRTVHAGAHGLAMCVHAAVTAWRAAAHATPC